MHSSLAPGRTLSARWPLGAYVWYWTADGLLKKRVPAPHATAYHPNRIAQPWPAHRLPFFFFLPCPPPPPAPACACCAAWPAPAAPPGPPTGGVAVPAAASSSTAATAGAGASGSAAIFLPREPSSCTSRDTSAALVVLYLRHTPEWGSKVLMISDARGGFVAAAAAAASASVMGVSSSPSFFAFLAVRAFAGLMLYFVVTRACRQGRCLVSDGTASVGAIDGLGTGPYSGEKTYGCRASFDEKSGLGEPLLAREYVRHCLCCFLPVQMFKASEVFT